jgi:hypothetical protein
MRWAWIDEYFELKEEGKICIFVFKVVQYTVVAIFWNLLAISLGSCCLIFTQRRHRF